MDCARPVISYNALIAHLLPGTSDRGSAQGTALHDSGIASASGIDL